MMIAGGVEDNPVGVRRTKEAAFGAEERQMVLMVFQGRRRYFLGRVRYTRKNEGGFSGISDECRPWLRMSSRLY